MARPDLSYLKSVFLFLVGVPLGLLSGLSGISGSVFGVPAVRKLLGLRPARVIGVSLCLAFFAALAALLSYGQNASILWGPGLLLLVFQTLGAVAAERLLQARPGLERGTALWGSLVICGGLAMAAQGLGFRHGPLLPHAILSRTAEFYEAAALLAAVVGLVSRVFGLGGVLLVPAAIYGLGLSPHAAQGTALFVLAVASLPGVLAHARRGDLEPQAATWLSAGAVLGALIGARLAVADVTDAGLLTVFGLLLTALGVQMLFRRDAALPPRPNSGEPY